MPRSILVQVSTKSWSPKVLRNALLVMTQRGGTVASSLQIIKFKSVFNIVSSPTMSTQSSTRAVIDALHLLSSQACLEDGAMQPDCLCLDINISCVFPQCSSATSSSKSHIVTHLHCPVEFGAQAKIQLYMYIETFVYNVFNNF